MSQIVKLRRSSVSGQKPTNTNLQLGELALNTTDGKVYMAVSGSLGPSVEELISTNTVNTGSINLIGDITASNISSSFIGDGSRLYNIPLSGVTNLTTISGSLDSRLDVLEAYSSSQLVPSSSMSFRTLQTDVYCKNMSGAQINKGTVVRITGAVGDNPLIGVASLLTEGQSANTLGIATENIPNDGFGLVITEGVLTGVNTSGMTAGQLIFLGENGTFTTSYPVAPNHGVRLGEVLRVQQQQGSIYVRIDNGSELGEAHDVYDTTTNSSYGDLLVKSGSVWVNSRSLNGDYAVTGSLTITQNLTVLGSSSLVYVTSSQLAVSASFISVNIFEPAERFGGLKVYDSGSSNATASLAWDSLHNHWIYQNSVDDTYSGGMLLSGPRNTGSLGDEPGLISGRIVKSVGGDHIDVSIISETGTTITVAGDLVANSITGAFDFFGLVNRPTLVSGSSQISYTGITDIPSGIVSGSEQLTGSYDTRYVLSGSITQTTWDNIANKPSDIVSSSTQISTFGFLQTSSFNSFTSSYTTGAFTGSFIGDGNGLYNIPASGVTGLQLDKIVSGNASASIDNNGFYVNRNVYIDGTITANELYIDYVTSSVLYQSGSTKFGDTADDNHNFTGSVYIDGSLNVDSITGSINFNNLTNVPTLVSGSSQISYTGITDVPNGIVSGSQQVINLGFTTTSSFESFTSSYTTHSSSFDTRINTITGSINELNTFTSSVVLTSQTSSMSVLTSSYALTASFALNAGAGGGGGGIGTYQTLTQTVAATTWSFAHNVGQRYPIFQVFDDNGNVIIPTQIKTIDNNNAEIIFGSAQTGKVVASLGGGNGTTQEFTSSSLWIVDHDLGTDYPDVTIWDSNRNIIFPNRIESVNTNQIKVYFSVPVSGHVSVSRGGHLISGSVDLEWNNITNKPNGIVSGSEQLTGSYDTRYVLSGSITQTTWDNIANKPNGIVSGSVQVDITGTTGYSTFSSSIATTDLNQNNRLGSLETESGSIRSIFNSFTSSYTTGSFTGSFIGDGNGLYNIPASGVTGLNLNKIISGSVSASISPDRGFEINTDVYINGSITANELFINYVTSSVLYESGSTKFGDTSDDIHEFTGSVNITGSISLNGNPIGTGKLDETTFNTFTSSYTTGSFTGSFIGDGSGLTNLSNITGSLGQVAILSSDKTVSGSLFTHVTNQTFGLGTNAVNNDSPERLMVDNFNSYNIATFQTSQQETYAEVNIKNFGSGSSSSADLVIWNDVSTPSSSFLNLGINSSNYNAGYVGYGGDGYLFNHSNDLYLGSMDPTESGHGHVHIFGGGMWDSSSLSIYSDGTIGINTDRENPSATTIPSSNNGYAVEISGSVKFRNDINTQGSTKFGDNLTDNHQFTGSVIISGSLDISSANVGSSRYLHTQTNSSATWSISHNLGYDYPNVTVYDGSNNRIMLPADVISVNANTTEVTFATPEYGFALVSVGGITTATADRFLFTATSATGSWVIDHNLGYKYPNIDVYDNNDEQLIPQKVKAVSVNRVQIDFSTPTSGNAIITLGGPRSTSIFNQTGSFYTTQYNIGITGSLVVTGDVDADNFNTTSDKKLKTDLLRIEGALDKIEKLNGYTFNWLEEYNEDRTRQIGLIADEVYEVQPELITKRHISLNERREEIKLLDYSKVTALLLEGIKELTERVAKLENKRKKK